MYIMKTKFIFIAAILFLFIGIQNSFAQLYIEEGIENADAGENDFFSLAQSPSDDSSPNNAPSSAPSNDWSKNNNAATKSTSEGDVPIGNGVYVLLFLGTLYFFYSRQRIKVKQE